MADQKGQKPEHIRLQDEYYKLLLLLGEIQDSLATGDATQELMVDGSFMVGDVNLSELERQVHEAKRLWDEALQRAD